MLILASCTLCFLSKPEKTSHFIAAPTTQLLLIVNSFKPKYKASFIPVIIGVVALALNRLEYETPPNAPKVGK